MTLFWLTLLAVGMIIARPRKPRHTYLRPVADITGADLMMAIRRSELAKRRA